MNQKNNNHFFTSHIISVNAAAEGAENGVEFSIVRPFNWIGPRMDFIPGVDGPQDSVPRVLACFSNVSEIFVSHQQRCVLEKIKPARILLSVSYLFWFVLAESDEGRATEVGRRW
jgi:hypothetical protein